jgi:predicted RNase H-like nuclease (RuvC/YqgF family)
MQERQLQLSTVAATESRKEAEDANRRLQELTEQIQTDDRVERLEQSLKHSQDRADELEFQLSKLRQVFWFRGSVTNLIMKLILPFCQDSCLAQIRER